MTSVCKKHECILYLFSSESLTDHSGIFVNPDFGRRGHHTATQLGDQQSRFVVQGGSVHLDELRLEECLSI